MKNFCFPNRQQQIRLDFENRQFLKKKPHNYIGNKIIEQKESEFCNNIVVRKYFMQNNVDIKSQKDEI